MPCKLSDLGLLIGLTSLPMSRERPFWKKIIKEIFSGYKERADEHAHARGQSSSPLYHPRGYVLLSEHDLAVVSLYDDALFPALTFRAGEASLRRDFDPELEPLESFTHHGMGGFIPQFNKHLEADDYWNLIFPPGAEEAAGVANKKLPLVMISQLKLASLLSLHAGTSALRCILWAIVQARYEFEEDERKRAEEEGRAPHPIRLMLSECHSWNEITMLVWSDCFTTMGRFLTRIGEIDFGRLSSLLDRLVVRKRGKFLREPDGGRREGRFRALEEEIAEFRSVPTLLQESLAQGNDVWLNHVFENSISHLGFDIELFLGGQDAWLTERGKGFLPPDDSVDLKVVRRWFTRRGHLARGYALVHPGGVGRDGFILSMEKGDFFQGPPETFTARGLINTIIESRSTENVHLHLTRAITSVGLDLSDEELLVVGQEADHPKAFDDVVSGLVVHPDTINGIFGRCQALSVPKVVTTKLLNCLSALNEGLRDRVTMAPFLDLKSFPKQVEAVLKHYEEAPPGWEWGFEHLVRDLWWLVDWFEVAYRNRIHSNYRLGGESSDLALDYKGCIHQLITGLDGAYKAICGAFEVDNVYACVGSVSGDPKAPISSIQATETSVQFNFIYAMQPEFAAFSLIHEAAHFANLAGLPTRFTETLRGSHDPRDAFALVLMKGLEKKAASKYKGMERDLLAVVRNKKGNFYNEVMADMANFFFAYGCDLSLYRWWTSSFPWQNVLAHRSTRVKEVKAQQMQQRLRALAACKFAAPAVYSNYRSNTKDDATKVYFEFLDELLERPLNPVRGWLHAWADEIGEQFCRSYGSMESYWALVGDFSENLRGGYVCEFEQASMLAYQPAGNHRETDTDKIARARLAYVGALFCGMLRLIRTETGRDRPVLRQRLLKRTREKGFPDPQPDQNDYLFDPRGGVFIRGEESRRKVMRWRAAFHMSLWDLSAKMKADEIRAAKASK